MTWLITAFVQDRIPLSPAWATLDVVRHGAAAALCALGLQPRWGWRPIIAACSSGTLLDLDHAFAAASIDPAAMMALGARPPSHSLAAAALLGALAWLLSDRVTGYAVAVGITVHLLDDGLSRPGVPLLFPLIADAHLLIPAPVAVLVVGALVAQSARAGRRQ